MHKRGVGQSTDGCSAAMKPNSLEFHLMIQFRRDSVDVPDDCYPAFPESLRFDPLNEVKQPATPGEARTGTVFTLEAALSDGRG